MPREAVEGALRLDRGPCRRASHRSLNMWCCQHQSFCLLVTHKLRMGIEQEVCRSLGLDLRGQTSASYNMRLNYEKSLLDFEHYLSSGSYAADVAAGAAMLICVSGVWKILYGGPITTAT